MLVMTLLTSSILENPSLSFWVSHTSTKNTSCVWAPIYGGYLHQAVLCNTRIPFRSSTVSPEAVLDPTGKGPVLQDFLPLLQMPITGPGVPEDPMPPASGSIHLLGWLTELRETDLPAC